jgi:hypothetical protein
VRLRTIENPKMMLDHILSAALLDRVEKLYKSDLASLSRLIALSIGKNSFWVIKRFSTRRRFRITMFSYDKFQVQKKVTQDRICKTNVV